MMGMIRIMERDGALLNGVRIRAFHIAYVKPHGTCTGSVDFCMGLGLIVAGGIDDKRNAALLIQVNVFGCMRGFMLKTQICELSGQALLLWP